MSDQTLTVRPTVESDTLKAISMSGMPRVPMPLPVIANLHGDNGGVLTVPTLYAMAEDDGFVATMMLNTDAGLYVRYSNAWHLLTDEDVVDGLSVHEVGDSALDMFDQFDRAGQLVNVGAMPVKGKESEDVTIEQTVIPSGTAGPTPTNAPVTAAATMTVPTLASAEDLPAALAAAVSNPELQWWVARRVKALGLDVELPWE